MGQQIDIENITDLLLKLNRYILRTGKQGVNTMDVVQFARSLYQTKEDLYEDVDIRFENPHLYRNMLKDIIKCNGDYFCNIYGDNSEEIQNERETIGEIQRDLIKEKWASQHEDKELSHYKFCYQWGEFNSNDSINVVYWSPEFERFVNRVKENSFKLMVDLFNFNFHELYFEKGYNYTLVDKITKTFKIWCQSQLNKTKNNEDITLKEDFIDDIVDEFFK